MQTFGSKSQFQKHCIGVWAGGGNGGGRGVRENIFSQIV